VINLCSSTTPMALPHPDSPELKRFSFFVSRRLEDGRERFRLHMGYFDSMVDAEEWLAVVREVYPGAWAGEAPGKRLRERTGAAPTPPSAQPTNAPAASAPPAKPQPARAQAAKAQPTKPSPAKFQPAEFPHVAAPAARKPIAAPPPVSVPTLQPAAATSSPQKAAAPAAAARTPAAKQAAKTATPAAAKSQQPARPPAQPAKSAAVAAAVTTPKPATAPAVPSKSKAIPLSHSNVREVLNSLDETGATRLMPAPPPAPAPAPAVPVARVAEPAPPAARSISDSQVLRILEDRRADGAPADRDASISMLKPDDTGTRRALQDAVSTNAPVSFAVQLLWSVQPVDLQKVPPLAIFSAYTLYTVEGSREGRRWYGLRLGFFSDAISAKQVAQYVRSEFNSVAIVPVSPQERGRATDADKGAVVARSTAPAAVQTRLPERSDGEFKLLDDDTPAVNPPTQRAAEKPASAPASRPAVAAAPKKAPAPAPAPKRSARAGSGRVRATDKRAPQTLEETLEILGADQLEIDSGKETVNDSGVRHLKVTVQKNSPLTRLLDRLTERARKDR
jgi:hypothetical protein